MSVYFTRGATTITLKNPMFPEGVEPVPRQVIGEAVGGAVKVAIVGSPDIIVNIRFKNITAADHTALYNFILNTVQFSAYTFQYQDWNETTIVSMRYMKGIDTWKRGRGGVYAGSLEFKEDLGTV
jgi:hypothetical protein